MVIMFQNRWEEQILAGTKVQTVRPRVKRFICAGTLLSLRVWSGAPYRSKQRELLRVICTSATDVEIHVGGVKIGDSFLGVEDNDKFAKRDGFADYYGEMVEWFEKMHGLPFVGRAIAWD